jgi:hypothetical protein
MDGNETAVDGFKEFNLPVNSANLSDDNEDPPENEEEEIEEEGDDKIEDGEEEEVEEEEDDDSEDLEEDVEEEDDEDSEDSEEDEDPEPNQDDIDARTAKAITFKTSKGDKIKVPKDALFPYKQNGKITWIPAAKLARQFDGIQNYSEKLTQLNDERNKINGEMGKKDAEIKGFQETISARKDEVEKIKNIFANGTNDQKLQALSYMLENDASVSPRLFIYDLMDHLGPYFEKWSTMSEEGRRAARAEAQVNWFERTKQIENLRQQEEAKEKEQMDSIKQVQEQIESVCKMYGLKTEDYDKTYLKLKKAHEKGDLANKPTHQEVFVETMRENIYGLAKDLGPKKVNPIFKDPKKAEELGKAMFDLWRLNPNKPQGWFLKIAIAEYGQKKAAKKINKRVKGQGKARTKGTGRGQKGKGTLPPNLQNWKFG